MALKKTRIEVNNAVFSLPYHVAKEEGYFADEGYDVELVPADDRIVGAKLTAAGR